MNQRKRHALIKEITRQGLPSKEGALPVVALEDFFIGNDDVSSIGCNLPTPPGPEVFFNVLRTIRDRPEVQDVLVEISEVDEEDADVWPFSERVYILTSASQDDVAQWIAPLEPDDIAEGWAFGTPAAAAALRPGITVYSAWWD